MKEQFCQHRDDYLLDELEGDRRTEFEEHLSECLACRAYLETQSRFDRILTDVVHSVDIPSHLAGRIESSLLVERRRKRTRLATFVVMPLVAGLFALIYFSAEPQRKLDSQTEIVQHPERIEQDTQTQTDVDSILPEPELPPVQVEFTGDVFAMQIESGDPDVTLIQIFEVNPFEHGKRK